MKLSFLFPLLLPFLLGACGIFEPRDPEPPSQLSSSFVPPTDPALVFQNLTGAFRERNALNYSRCLSDSSMGAPLFQFEPDPQAFQQYAAVFAAWSRQAEQQSFEAMNAAVPSGSAMTLELQSLTPQGLNADSAKYEIQYRLTIPHSRSSISTVALGRSLLVLTPDRSRNWAISRWVDLALAPDDFTWSKMKGAFGQ